MSVDIREEEHEEVGHHSRQTEALDAHVKANYAEEAENEVDGRRDYLSDHRCLRVLQASEKATFQVEET